MTPDPIIIWAWVVVKVLVTLIKFGLNPINAKYSVGLDAFLVKMTFLTPVTPEWPLTPPSLVRE